MEMDKEERGKMKKILNRGEKGEGETRKRERKGR